MLRGRGEELYVLCERWVNGLFTLALRRSSVMEGKLTYNQVLDMEIAEGNQRPPDFSRVEMLIDVYFPSVRSAYDQVAGVRESLNALVNQHKRAYAAGDVDGTAFLGPILAEMRNVNSTGTALKEAVKRALRSI